MPDNRTLTADIIAAESVMILDNSLVMAKQVYRGYEDEFSKLVNGYTKGESVTIRKPADFTVGDGAVADVQDVIEGKLTFTVNTRKHIAFKFSSQDLTMNIKDLSDRVMRPALIQLANQVDRDLMSLYKSVPNWVGTPGQKIDSFSDFYAGAERLNEMAVPEEDRVAVLSPADHAALLGSQTGLFISNAAEGAYRRANLGSLGDIETFMSQNVPLHTVGSADDASAETRSGGTGLLSTTYDDTKDLGYMDLATDGWDATKTLKAGDVITIATVYDVNPVTKETLDYLKMFTVVNDVTTNGTTANETTVRISPPIIPTGAFQNVSNAPADNQAITLIGTKSTGYRQNMVFHKNAFGLVMVPLASPPGAVDVARKTYQGTGVRVIPVYDGINDFSMWRLDILYGVQAIDPRLAVRLSGAA